MNRNQELLSHFGLDADMLFWSDQHERHAARIRDAITSRRMLAVCGRFGCGKSWLVRETVQAADHTDVIYVANPDREHIRIGHVITAIVRRLSDEAPRQGVLDRTYQVARLMGEKVIRQKRDVCVVVENAHRLHAKALLKLKDLRESAIYQGHDFLFSVVLVGQDGLRAKLDRYGEVKYRSKTLDLSEEAGWMDHAMRSAYLRHIYGDVIAEPARQHLAGLYRSPLELDYTVEEKLETLRNAGLNQLTLDQIDLSVRKQREALGISQSDLEEATARAGDRVPKSSISDFENNRSTSEERRRKLQEGLDQLIREQKSEPERTDEPDDTPREVDTPSDLTDTVPTS
jgi:type II secretory pathway predicted ATPase ExeA